MNPVLNGSASTQTPAASSLPAAAPVHGQAGPAPDLVMVPLVQIQSSLFNPRKRFDEAALRELADSILAQGIIEPLVLREISRGCYEIVAGERRFRALKLAGWTEAPAIIRRDLDKHAAARMMAVENLQRVDLTPIEEARAFQAWIGAAGRADGKPNPVKELAASIGKSDDYIRERMWLLKLDDRAQQMVDDGRVTVKAGLLLARIKDEKMRTELLEKAAEGELTPSEVGNYMQDHLVDLTHAPFALDKPIAWFPVCQGCQYRKYRSSNMLLPGLEGKKDLGVCINTTCYFDKARIHFEQKRSTVITSYDDARKKYPMPGCVIEWKNGCKGCEEKLVYITRENPEGEFYCADIRGHWQSGDVRRQVSPEQKASLKKEMEKRARRREQDVAAKKAITEYLTKSVLQDDPRAAEFLAEAIAGHARQDYLCDCASVLMLKESGRNPISGATPLGRRRFEIYSQQDARIAITNSLKQNPGLALKAAIAYIVAMRFVNFDYSDKTPSVEYAKKHGIRFDGRDLARSTSPARPAPAKPRAPKAGKRGGGK